MITQKGDWKPNFRNLTLYPFFFYYDKNIFIFFS